MTISRRHFVTQLSTAAAAGLMAPPVGRLLQISKSGVAIPDLEAARLRQLALVAVDAARGAGATFADVRVTAGQRLRLHSSFARQRGPAPTMYPPTLAHMAGYGVRAVVEGAWGFAAANELTPDAVARAARLAVARARGNRPRRPRTLALAPVAPIPDGRWATPIERDPFAVPLDEQLDRQFGALAATAALPVVQWVDVIFQWDRAERVFASSEGTVLAQRTAFAEPKGYVGAAEAAEQRVGQGRVEEFEDGPFGYEVVGRVDLVAGLRRATELALADARRPPGPQAVPVDVGRYDLVLDPTPMAELLFVTLGAALNAERALGFQANGVGTSFAAPPETTLGQYRLGSPLLTVHADRTRSGGASTMAWDDEGAPTEAFTLVRDGVIVDYLTDRQCAAELGAYYASRGAPVRSHGCASGAGLDRPAVRVPNLTLEPGRKAVTKEDLIADTRRGLYINGLQGDTDQQVASGQFRVGANRIRNGRIAEPVSGAAIQFLTTPFWRSLDALGGPATAQTTLWSLSYDPLQTNYASVSAVPGRFRQVNVLGLDRQG